MGGYGGWSVHMPHSLATRIFSLLSRRVLAEDSRYRTANDIRHSLTYRTVDADSRHILTPMVYHKEDIKSCGWLWRTECAHTSQLSDADLLLALALGGFSTVSFQPEVLRLPPFDCFVSCGILVFSVAHVFFSSSACAVASVESCAGIIDEVVDCSGHRCSMESGSCVHSVRRWAERWGRGGGGIGERWWSMEGWGEDD